MGTDKASKGSSTTTKTQQSDSVEVDIQGETIKVRSNREREFVKELAEYVDGKAEAIREKAPKVPLKRRLLLVSMMVAEDFFETQERLDELEDTFEEKVGGMREKIDKLKGLIDDSSEQSS